MRAESATNALGGETSPYLLQHAANPVEWYPWGEEALARARREDKPILLSIGYSACHWCHVMAHESFEDEETAALMNALFVNVKVDREERPDLDKIYQVAHQLLTRRAGGWPLTMFLTPDDHAPFFGGTYFPPEPRFGMPSFRDLIRRVADFYREHRDEIRRQNAALAQAMLQTEPAPASDGAIGPAPLADARATLERTFDARHGGFGDAPKFPHPSNLERLLRHHAGSVLDGRPDEGALDMVGFTLARMALGGIYDQLGGGFCRYSVDERWMIPHFEKMLYDNAPLLELCAQAWQVSGAPLLARVADETATWTLREMQSPEGGYWSTLDADSEGEEGRFYLWTPDEVRGLLDDEEYRVVAARFGLDREPNFEGRAWHLHVYRDGEALARATGLDEETIARRLDDARAKLLEVRARRVWPGRDEKVLTAWNALMIKAMACAARVLGRDDCLDSAERALGFVRERLWRDGRLLAVHKDGRSRFPAYLDDHAFLLDALLALLGCRWRGADLAFTVEIAETLLARFRDADGGGFFFTADDHERLFHRPRSSMDDALPAGNGIAAFALGRLGHLLGESRYIEAASGAVRAAWDAVARYPHAHNTMLLALEEMLNPPEVIVMRGEAPALERWRRRALRHYAPRRVVVAIPSAESALPGLLAERVPRGEAVAYVCRGHVCDAPVTAFEAFDEVLASGEVPGPDVGVSGT